MRIASHLSSSFPVLRDNLGGETLVGSSGKNSRETKLSKSSRRAGTFAGTERPLLSKGAYSFTRIMEVSRLRTWTPAVPHKTPDNIVSSDYANMKHFVPSYEKCEPCIEQLLANDYQRIWWREKHTWDQNIITRQIAGARKKILPRKLIKRKVPSCVTVKYRTRAERLDGKAEKEVKEKKVKERPGTEETKFAEDDDTKSEKSKETKLEKHEESKECEDTKSQREDTVSNSSSGKREKTKSGKSEGTKLKENEKTKVEQGEEETRSKENGEIKVEQREEAESKTLGEKVEEENSVKLEDEKKREETKLENDQDKELEE